ncbi:MAG: alanyl-tRNA editing protein [Thermoplasmatota archaeon]
MTDLLWMPAWRGEGPNPNYVREFEAHVQKATASMGGEAPWLLLDRTAFYAEGGGQPSDAGLLTWDGGEAQVVHVGKKGAVKHAIQPKDGGPLPAAGTVVHGAIDWPLRHAHMRMHTSQHILSGMMWKLRHTHTVGNQIHADHSRVDFDAVLREDDIKEIQDRVNALLAKPAIVRIYEEDRSVVEQRTGDRGLLALVPQSAKRLRIVEILADDEVADVCPCAGTHVATTAEIGRMEITSRASKGDGRTRLEYALRS